MNNILKILVLFAALWAGAATAEIDYEAWAAQAERSQKIISNASSSDLTLESLREQLVEKRAAFADAEEANAPEIATVKDQIAALGPVPAEGQSEGEEIAARRTELTARLSDLRAPGLRAEETQRQISGMIAQIDQTLRERQTSKVMRHGALPLTPGFWAEAFEELTKSLPSLTPQFEVDLDLLPGALLLAGLGAFLLARGRKLAMSLANLARKLTRRGTGVWEFIASLGQVLLPFIGFTLLLVASLSVLVLTGPLENFILETASVMLSLLVVGWLARRLFPLEGVGLLHIETALHGAFRRQLIFGGAVLAGAAVVAFWARSGGWSLNAGDAWHLPLVLLGALCLWRLARLLRLALAEREAGPQGFVRQVARLLRRALVLAGLAGVLLVLAGYHAAGAALVFQSLRTVFLLGMVMVLQDFLASLWILLSNGKEEDREGLVPTLLGFLLALTALPMLALIWGARATDLTELWQRFQGGFSLGATRISPGIFITFAVVFAIGYMATRMLQSALRNSVLPKTRLDRGGQNALVSGVGYVGIFLAALIAITTAGIDLSGLAIVAGALSVGIGFGLQNIVSNFVSGVILLIERPIAIGDWIEVGGKQGYVRAISVRSTRIETFDRFDVIVPNADFVSGPVTNYTRSNTIGRLILPVGVAYGTDTRRVQELLLEVARDVPNVMSYPAPYAVFQNFGASTYDLELRVYLRDVNSGLSTRTELNHRIRECFEREGIEIAFPQQDVWVRGMVAPKEEGQ